MTAAVTESCVTCAREIDTPFCPSCGERRASDRSYSLWKFLLEEVVSSVTSFDGRVFRTARTLIRKPGELTVAFMRGSRLPYLAPLQLFFLCNLVFFLWSSAVGMRIFDTQLAVHVGGQPYSAVAKRMVLDRLTKTGTAEKLYTARFDAIGSAQARTLVIAMVPAFALVIAVLLFRRRHRAPFVQHLVFSLHAFSFLFLMLIASAYVIDIPLIFALKALGVRPGYYGYDAQVSLAMMVVFCGYLAIAARRAYDIGRLRSVATALLLGASYYIVLQTYRGLLFFVTFYSM